MLKTLQITFIAVMVSVLLLALGLFAMQTKPAQKLPFIGGYTPLVVLSGSMEPHLPVGGIVVTKPVEPWRVHIGDVITFKTPLLPGQVRSGERPLTTHRVTAVNMDDDGNGIFTTKGDANEDPDAWQVTDADVVGREAFALPYLGYLSNFIKTRTGFLLLVLAPGLLVIATELRSIFVQLRASRKAAHAEKI